MYVTNFDTIQDRELTLKRLNLTQHRTPMMFHDAKTPHLT